MNSLTNEECKKYRYLHECDELDCRNHRAIKSKFCEIHGGKIAL